MNNQDQVPTIAELWGRLQFKAAQERDRESGAAIYPDKADNWRAFAQKARDEYAPIRQQLVERCGSTTLQNGWMAFCFAGKNVGITSTGTLYANHIELTELSSICAFWAWELEQREKESKGD